jgi:hypothetical protein
MLKMTDVNIEYIPNEKLENALRNGELEESIRILKSSAEFNNITVKDLKLKVQKGLVEFVEGIVINDTIVNTRIMKYANLIAYLDTYEDTTVSEDSFGFDNEGIICYRRRRLKKK